MSEDKTLAKVNKMAHRFSENSTLTVAQIEREITALIQDRQTEAVRKARIDELKLALRNSFTVDHSNNHALRIDEAWRFALRSRKEALRNQHHLEGKS